MVCAFTGAVFTGAVFTGAVFTGAVFTGAAFEAGPQVVHGVGAPRPPAFGQRCRSLRGPAPRRRTRPRGAGPHAGDRAGAPSPPRRGPPRGRDVPHPRR